MNDIFTCTLTAEQKRMAAMAITGWALRDAELISQGVADDAVKRVYDTFCGFFGDALGEYLPTLKKAVSVAETQPQALSYEEYRERVRKELLLSDVWCENMHRQYHIQTMPEAIDEFFEYIEDHNYQRIFIGKSISEIKGWFARAATNFLSGSLVWADSRRNAFGSYYFMHRRDEC